MRRRRSRHSDDQQLQLFQLPGRRARAPRAARELRAVLRLPLTVAAVALATAGAISGSYAVWTAQTMNPGNSVTAGTLSLANGTAGAVITASNVVPGDSGSNTVTLTNDGTVAETVLLTQDSMTATGIESSLRLKVYDQTRNWCYWPVNQSGACPGTGGVDGDGYGAWDATGTLDALALPAISGAAKWPAAEAHTFTIAWKLSASSPNTDQGKSGSFRLVWDGTS